MPAKPVDRYRHGGAMSRRPLTVGIIANPASGRDVRRLTANAGPVSYTHLTLPTIYSV